MMAPSSAEKSSDGLDMYSIVVVERASCWRVAKQGTPRWLHVKLTAREGEFCNGSRVHCT